MQKGAVDGDKLEVATCNKGNKVQGIILLAVQCKRNECNFSTVNLLLPPCWDYALWK